MGICKTTYTFVVYHEDDTVPEGLGHAISESFDGSMVGAVVNEETVHVNAEDVMDELKAIGNDGTFFDREDD